jgi:methionyl aminopeptidase
VWYRLEADLYDKVRLASEVHRQVRKYAQSFIKPGIKLADMCEMIENKNRELIQVRERPRAHRLRSDARSRP